MKNLQKMKLHKENKRAAGLPFFRKQEIMKKNDRLIRICTGYTVEGAGIVKVDDFCFFVKNVLKGEKVEFVITALKKSYGYGHLIQVLEPSDERVEPVCSMFKQCGGCTIQHFSAKEQADFKTERVRECFRQIAHLDCEIDPILSAENPLYYRNKVQIPFGRNKSGNLVSGFYRAHSHDIVDCKECHVQSEIQNKIHQFLFHELMGMELADEIRHILIKHAFNTNEVMVVLIARKQKLPHIDELVRKMTAEFDCIKSVILNVNDRNDNVILGEKEILLYGKDSIQDRCGEYVFNISSKSFYQINSAQTEVLYQKAIEYARLTGNETVLDLYCGIGTIGIFASKHAKKVLGVEIVEEAIENAKVNAKLNGINNIDFICGDAGKIASELVTKKMQPDVIIVDPPRKGLDIRGIEAIVTMFPERVVYVSCNPATLARDCALLNDRGYCVEKVQPVDMFPLTSHVESIVLLQKR